MNDIANNLDKVRAEINAFATEFNRDPGSVRLLAVSKTKPVQQIRKALELGQKDFGENYLDEALDKINELGNHACSWHFIGKIQSNKTGPIAKHFSWVHTLDRYKIAARLSQQRPDSMTPLNCCIQINIDKEASKSGILQEHLEEFAAQIMPLPNLRVRGLMVIPENRSEFEAQNAVFTDVRKLFLRLKSIYPHMDTLSMGMSGDTKAAIAQGATIVRIGTAIFGSRRSSA